jgi:GMP synthase (glutamine-hydrolysing)
MSDGRVCRSRDYQKPKTAQVVGDKGLVLGAVSRRVDLAVAAKLMHEAIRSRFHAVLVNHDVMHLFECEQVQEITSEYVKISTLI